MRWILLLLLAAPAQADERESCRGSDSPACNVAWAARILSWVARLPATIFHEAVEPDLRRQLETGVPAGARSAQDGDGRTHWTLDFVPVAAPDRYRRH